MPNSQSHTSKAIRAKNAARWIQEQQAAGAYRLSVLLPPDSAAQLQSLAKKFGSNRAAILAVLNGVKTMTQYPLSPLTAALAAGGWQLEAALAVQADPQFEAADDVAAIEAAIELGWNGAGLDALLESWLGQKWAVMTALCAHSGRFGGLTLAQGQTILSRLDSRGMAGDADLAVALRDALFRPEVGAAAETNIRAAAQRLLDAMRET